MNRVAIRRMRGKVRLEMVSGATHLFEERGAMDRVAERAGDWFTHYRLPDTRVPEPKVD
jgi:hypothetical protein